MNPAQIQEASTSLLSKMQPSSSSASSSSARSGNDSSSSSSSSSASASSTTTTSESKKSKTATTVTLGSSNSNSNNKTTDATTTNKNMNDNNINNNPDIMFPVRLHSMLDEIELDGLQNIVSWQPHGRCFLVRDQQKFVTKILPKWFNQASYPSFQRQLNLYGFRRISAGRDKGCYWHAKFLRGMPNLAQDIRRVKIKGTGPRKPSDASTEPNFYLHPFLTRSSVAAANNKAAASAAVLVPRTADNIGTASTTTTNNNNNPGSAATVNPTPAAGVPETSTLLLKLNLQSSAIGGGAGEKGFAYPPRDNVALLFRHRRQAKYNCSAAVTAAFAASQSNIGTTPTTSSYLAGSHRIRQQALLSSVVGGPLFQNILPTLYPQHQQMFSIGRPALSPSSAATPIAAMTSHPDLARSALLLEAQTIRAETMLERFQRKRKEQAEIAAAVVAAANVNSDPSAARDHLALLLNNMNQNRTGGAAGPAFPTTPMAQSPLLDASSLREAAFLNRRSQWQQERYYKSAASTAVGSDSARGNLKNLPLMPL